MRSLLWLLLVVSLPTFFLFVVLASAGLQKPPFFNVSNIEYYSQFALRFGSGLIGWVALFVLFYLAQYHPRKRVPVIIYVGIALGFLCCFLSKTFFIYGIPAMLLAVLLLIQKKQGNA